MVYVCAQAGAAERSEHADGAGSDDGQCEMVDAEGNVLSGGRCSAGDVSLVCFERPYQRAWDQVFEKEPGWADEFGVRGDGGEAVEHSGLLHSDVSGSF